MNIGAALGWIRPRLYEAMTSVRYWANEADMGALEVATRAHHLLVQIHPFVDVNGRITRLYADLVLLALTGDRVVDWSGAEADKQVYIAALRVADTSGDVHPLLAILAERDLGLGWWPLLIRDCKRRRMPLCWLAPPTGYVGVLVACECRPPAVMTTSNAQRWPAAGPTARSASDRRSAFSAFATSVHIMAR